jgi:hypothetical protein
MSSTVFDRETLLDLTVNVIPLGIILFFFGAFAVFSPFSWDSTYSVLQFGILSTMFVALTALTYYSGKLIAIDEQSREEADHGSE